MRLSSRSLLAICGALALIASPAVAPAAAAEQSAASSDGIVINEVNSDSTADSGSYKDFIELTNTSDEAKDISGWVLRDNDDKDAYIIPDGTTLKSGGFYVAYVDDEANGKNKFGLGKNDSARLFLPDGTTKVDENTWTKHVTSAARLPDGTGGFSPAYPTPGAANSAKKPADTPSETPKTPGQPPAAEGTAQVVINEVESNGDADGDWVELANRDTTNDVDISGWGLVDNDPKHKPLKLPAGTKLESGGYLRVFVDQDGGFGLGSDDSVTLTDAVGTTQDTTAWTSHAATTWGRIPDMTGDFTETGKPTPGAKNEAAGTAEPSKTRPWPFDPLEAKSAVAKLGDVFAGEDMSGVDFDARGDAYVVNNGNSTLYHLHYDAAADEYSILDSHRLRYSDGSGSPDSEGVTVGPNGKIYVATERNNDVKNTSRPSVLEYALPASTGRAADATAAKDGKAAAAADTAAGAELAAQAEWNLSAITGELGANAGLEAIEWIPEKSEFAVGVEQTGQVLFVKLHAGGSAELAQRYQSPLAGVMALDYTNGSLLAMCDEVCDGRGVELKADKGGEFAQFGDEVARPAGTENFANEGFARFDQTLTCADGSEAHEDRFLWTDDNGTDGVGLRQAKKGSAGCDDGQEPATDPATDPEDNPGADDMDNPDDPAENPGPEDDPDGDDPGAGDTDNPNDPTGKPDADDPAADDNPDASGPRPGSGDDPTNGTDSSGSNDSDDGGEASNSDSGNTSDNGGSNGTLPRTGVAGLAALLVTSAALLALGSWTVVRSRRRG